MKSLFLGGERQDKPMAIDPIPVLTEIGNRRMGGPQMAYLQGVSAATTDDLAGTWTGDLLQIVDELPAGFEVIKCAFADIWNRADYCYQIFGLNDDGLIKEGDGLYEAAPLSVMGTRGTARYIKVELTEDKINYSTVPIEGE
jgi:hypothetical protein